MKAVYPALTIWPLRHNHTQFGYALIRRVLRQIIPAAQVDN